MRDLHLIGNSSTVDVITTETLQFLSPTNEICKGYVFIGVCLSSGGIMSGPLHAWIHPSPAPRPEAEIPLRQTSPGRHPPAQCMLGYGQQAGGTYPTGMHSCLGYVSPEMYNCT